MCYVCQLVHVLCMSIGACVNACMLVHVLCMSGGVCVIYVCWCMCNISLLVYVLCMLV